MKSLLPQVSITRAISSQPLVKIVLATIDLDHQPSRVAGKVNDQMIDRNLPAKVESPALEHAQAVPEFSFCISLVAAQLASTSVRH